MNDDAAIDVTANVHALECVRRFVQAEHRRDLLRFRERLHDEIVVRLDDAMLARGPDDVAGLAAHDWVAAPRARFVVEDLGVTAGLVTLRYHLFDGVIPGSSAREAKPADYVGRTVYEVFDDKIIRIWHYLQPTRSEGSTNT